MNYSGMTVNERLWESGLYEDFYAAVREKRVSRVVEILKQIELDDESVRMNLQFFQLTTEESNDDANTNPE